MQEFTFAFGQAVFSQLHSQSRKMPENFIQGLKSINAEIQIDDDDIRKIYNLFEGNTYRMQKTFHEVYDSVPYRQQQPN